MKLKAAFLSSLCALALFSASPAKAGGWQVPANPGGLLEDFMGAVGIILNWLMGLVTALAVLAIIYGGLVYVASSGDTKRTDDAKKTVKYAIMGLAMAGIAYAVVNVIITRILTNGGGATN
jgi:TRAP-type C4-dicarboxylate transport system permease small subunit